MLHLFSTSPTATTLIEEFTPTNLTQPSWDGAALFQPGAPRQDLPELAAVNKAAAAQKENAAAARGNDLSDLAALWIADDFSDPRDNELVAGEMNRLLKAETSRAKLIELRLRIDRAKADNAGWMDADEASVRESCKELRGMSPYAKLTDDEMIEMAADAGRKGSNSILALIRRSELNLDKERKTAAALAEKIKAVDARLAELNKASATSRADLR